MSAAPRLPDDLADRRMVHRHATEGVEQLAGALARVAGEAARLEKKHKDMARDHERLATAYMEARMVAEALGETLDDLRGLLPRQMAAVRQYTTRLLEELADARGDDPRDVVNAQEELGL